MPANKKTQENMVPQKTVPLLKLRYTIAMPVIVVLAIAAIMVIYTTQQKKFVLGNADYVAEKGAEQITQEVSLTIAYAKSSIKAVSTSVMINMDSAELKNPADILAPLKENTPFSGIEYIRADGMNVVTSGEAFDASDRVYYIEGIKGKSGVWVNYHPKTSKDALINFYTPLIYEGEVVGVITGYIEAMAELSTLLKSEFFGREVYGLILDGDDKILCSTDTTQYQPDYTLDMFLDLFNVSDQLKVKASEVLRDETAGAVAYRNSSGEGRVCVKKVANTDWRVVVFIPPTSFNAIVGALSNNAMVAILASVFVMLLYVVFVLYKTVMRRKEITAQNAKLEEDNRAFNERNKIAFKEISEIRDIIASANMGTWRIELVDGEEPRMYVDDKMRELLGIRSKDVTPENTYSNWFDNITHMAIPSVLASVERMKEGHFDENTYLWAHPTKGVRYVRCGGTSKKIPGGYLLSGYHYDVDEVVRAEQAQVEKLKAALQEKNEYNATLAALGDVFYSMHVIDLEEDSVTEFSARDDVKRIVNRKNGAREMMVQVMTALTADEYKEECLAFTDLTTIADRMEGKMFVSKELVGINVGWYEASFIVMETDEHGRAKKVIFATRVIDETKKNEERLIQTSRTDELTQVLNRRAYEEALQEMEEKGIPDDFAYISFDVNGLKNVNDSIGHEAGDELIVGGCLCIKRALGAAGKVYRTGGDEFVALVCADSQALAKMVNDLESNISGWHGKLVETLSISYGIVTRSGNAEASLHDIVVLADKRMYEAKSQYYRKNGVDRRGRKEAHTALCDLYSKILKINITDNSYQIVNMSKDEQITESENADTISGWLIGFAKTGNVYDEDLLEYYNKTEINYMRKYFAEHTEPLRVLYRRKYEDDYKQAIMEIIRANDYTDDNQNLFLYVKYIE